MTVPPASNPREAGYKWLHASRQRAPQNDSRGDPMRPCAVYTSSGAAHRLTDSLLVTAVVQGMDQLRQHRLDWRGNGSSGSGERVLVCM